MQSQNIRTTRRWAGIYAGDYAGNLWKTFNVDLDREDGNITLSRRLSKIADTTDTNTDTLGIIDAFVRTNADCTDRFWALSSRGALYHSKDSNPSDSWAGDTLASSPTDATDMAIFENDTLGDTSRQQLFVTRDSDIAVLNDTGNRAWQAAWWVTTQGHGSDSALKKGVPHPIEYFPFRRIMLIGDANWIHTASRTSDTVNETTTAKRLTLPQNLQIQHIFTTTSRAWILCANINQNGNGKIAEWDGSSTTYNNIHDAYGAVPLSGVNFRETPIIVNNKGLFLEFTGAGFTPMTRNGQVVAFPCYFEENAWSVVLSNIVTPVRARGMVLAEDGLIYIAVQHPNNNSFRHNGGIWCLNPLTGRLYQKHSIGNIANTSYGEQRTTLGALFPIPSGSYQSKFLIGGTYNNNSVSFDRFGIWVMENLTSTTATRGHVITQFIHSNEIRNFWDSIWLRFQKFLTTSNRIVVKARGIKPLKNTAVYPVEATITWVNATSFTVTLVAADEALAVGDEVEIINGDNSGATAHITAISGSHTASQTITIDETLTASTNVAQARFDRWKKLGTISSAKYEDVLNVGIDSNFIQFKIELRGPAVEMSITDLILNSNTSINTTK